MKYTAIFGAYDLSLTSVNADTAAQAHFLLENELNKPGRRDTLEAWIKDGARVKVEGVQVGFINAVIDETKLAEIEGNPVMVARLLVEVLALSENPYPRYFRVERGQNIQSFSVEMRRGSPEDWTEFSFSTDGNDGIWLQRAELVGAIAVQLQGAQHVDEQI